MQGLTAKEFRGWEQYYEIVPSESVKQDWRNASLKHMLYLVNRTKKSKEIPLKDFVLQWVIEEARRQGQTPAQQWAMLNAAAAMHANDDGPKIILTDAGETMIPAPPKNDRPGFVGELPPGFTLPSEVAEQLAKARAAMKKTD